MSDEQLASMIKCIESLYDNPELYEKLSARALHISRTRHSMENSTRRLLQALYPWIN